MAHVLMSQVLPRRNPLQLSPTLSIANEMTAKPTQNAHVGSFNGRLREECLPSGCSAHQLIRVSFFLSRDSSVRERQRRLQLD